MQSREEYIKSCIAKLTKERNEKIDAINEEQRVLNARRAGIYAQYTMQIEELQMELAPLVGRSSEISHP